MVHDIYVSFLLASSTVLPSETHQEFISEISGIASGEFALEQQLQKARFESVGRGAIKLLLRRT